MKKYMNPEIRIIKIAAEDIITTSDNTTQEVGIYDDGSGGDNNSGGING